MKKSSKAAVRYEDFRKILGWDRCVECGECLANCRYMEFSHAEAAAEIRKLNAGEQTRIIAECMSCYACNAFCPQEAHPYERIHYRWNTRYEKRGLPARAAYLMPGRRPNFRQDLHYSRAEKSLHARWNSDKPPARTFLYPGCNILAMPLLATGILFDRLPVWGNWDLCCGEMYYRMGILEPVRRTAEKLTRFYRNAPVDEMVFLCPACYNMFTHVLPKQFGADFHFKTVFFTDWLKRELAEGTFSFTRRLKGEVVMHDSCHARILGPAFMDGQREILADLGLTINETPLNREHGLCCGLAAGARKYSAVDLVAQSKRQLDTLDRAPGDQVAIYCSGCLLMLSGVRLMNPLGKKLVHSLEYIRRALGEKTPRRNMRRALGMTRGIARHALPAYLNPRRFRFSVERINPQGYGKRRI